jgi:ClpP class serine protease
VRAIHHTRPDQPIDLILHTPGGLALASLQIARALARHPAKVTAFVPHYAISGGTLLALAADEIVMSHHAVLGPVDPLVGPYPAASILRAIARKEPKDIDDETLILADQAEMAIRQLQQALCDLLVERLGEEQARAVVGGASAPTLHSPHKGQRHPGRAYRGGGASSAASTAGSRPYTSSMKRTSPSGVATAVR